MLRSSHFEGMHITELAQSTIPERLDRLPWSNWHLRVVIALGITWLLDGLEGSLGGSLAGALKTDRVHGGLALTDAQLGLSSSFYLAGAVIGALIFGYLADRYGRRRLFFWTLILYLCATAATGLSWNLASFTFLRILTGAGIGGEYAAINSAVDELMPARLRGRVDLWINGTFWLGIILGSIVSVALLSSNLFAGKADWRFAFCSGVPIGLIVLFMRRFIPESPRWLLTQNREADAERVVTSIELQIAATTPLPSKVFAPFLERPKSSPGLLILLSPAYRRRTVLCFFLMAAQAFFYNSVFFSLSLVLLRFYGASTEDVGYFFIPIAVTNFLGPLLLGRFFDTIGRRRMVSATYCLSGIILFASSWLFLQGRLNANTQVMWWAAAFFFASTAASSAYLTASEVFPQQIRSTAIAIFYAFGTLAGGVSGPLIFGYLSGQDHRNSLFVGYAFGAAIMIAAGIAQAIWGVDAEGKSLEDLAA